MADATIATAYVQLVPSVRGVQGALGKELGGLGPEAGKHGKSIGQRLSGSIVKWGKRVLKTGGAALGVTLATATTAGIKTGIGQQQTTKVLAGLYGDAGLAAKTIAQLNDEARKSPLGADAFRKGAETLAYAGVQGDAATKSLSNVAKAIVGSGGGPEQMKQFTGGIIDMVNRGQVGLEGLNRISQSGVPIFSSLAEKLGVGADEVRELATAGKIELPQVLEILESADTEWFVKSLKAGEEATKSLGNTSKVIWNNIIITVGDRLQPVIERVTDAALKFAEWVGPALDRLFDSFENLSGSSSGLSRVWEGVVSVASDLWDIVSTYILPAFKSFGENVGGAVVDAAKMLWDKLKDLGGWFSEHRDTIMNVARIIGDKLGTAIKAVGTVLGGFIRTATNVTKKLLEWKPLVIGVVGALATWKVTMAAIGLGKFVTQLALSAAGWVKETAATVANTAAKIASKAETAALYAMYAYDWVKTQAMSIAGWIRETAVMGAHKVAQVASTAATKAMTLGQKALNAVMKANPIGIVITVIMALVAAFVTAYKKSETFRNIVDKAWAGVKKAAEVAWNFIKKWVIDPWVKYFQLLWEGFKIVTDSISKAWSAVKDGLWKAWDWIKTRVVDGFKLQWDILKDTFNTITGAIKTAWEAIKSPFKKVWDWINTNVIDKFKTGLSNLKSHVTTIKDGMKSAWNAVANVFRKPINWVLDKVWNNGIAKAYNNAAKLLNLKTRLNNEARIPMFAEGGYHKGGWAIVGEEGPELVNFSNPGRIYTADETREALAGRGQPSKAALKRYEGNSPAEAVLPVGGWWDKTKSAASAIKDGIVNAATGAINWVRGGLADAAEFLLKPIRASIAGAVGAHGQFGRLGGDAAKNAIDGVVKWIRGKDVVEEGGTAGGLAGPLVGGKWVRPGHGRVTSEFGNRWGGLHAGIDISDGGGPTYAARAGKVVKTGWNIGPGRTGIGILLSHGGGAYTYYGHNPSMASLRVKPGDMVKAGQHIGRQGSTGNATGPHLHFEYHPNRMWGAVNPRRLGIFDNGGWLQPGHAALNLSSKPEPVLNARQWSAIENGGLTERERRADMEYLADMIVSGLADMARGAGLANDLARNARNRVRMSGVAH